MTRAQLLILAMPYLWPGLAAAEELLSGEDAAYIDWGVNNCAVKSTDKEHAMVDKANAKDAAGFLRKYQSKDLSAARSSPAKAAALCAEIKAWYGPYGSRFTDLIRWESASAATTSEQASDRTANRKGRKRSSP